MQIEFAKYATEWDDLSLDEQKKYMKKHPKTKKRLTAKPEKTEQDYDIEISKLEEAKGNLKSKLYNKKIETSKKPSEESVLDVFDKAVFEKWDDDVIKEQTDILKHHFPKNEKLIDEFVDTMATASNDRFEVENDIEDEKEQTKIEKAIEKNITKAKKLLNKLFE